MSADDFFEVCRLVASHQADAMQPSVVTLDSASGDEWVPTNDKPQLEGYTIQQIAAFKAHITMLRKSLTGLTGDAKATALKNLARHEARLATALATSRA